MAPGSIFHHIIFLSTCYFYRFYFAIFIFQSIQQYQKYLSYYLYQISLLQVAVKGLTTPFIALVARFLFVCVGAWDLIVISYWIDTLVLKN